MCSLLECLYCYECDMIHMNHTVLNIIEFFSFVLPICFIPNYNISNLIMKYVMLANNQSKGYKINLLYSIINSNSVFVF